MTRRKGTDVYRRLADLAGGAAFFFPFAALAATAGFAAFLGTGTAFFTATAFLAAGAGLAFAGAAFFTSAAGFDAVGFGAAGFGAAAFSLARADDPFTGTFGALTLGSGDPFGSPGPVFCTSVKRS